MYLQYYYLCEWEDVPPLLTLFFGPARATTAFAERGTERKAVHHSILTVTYSSSITPI